MHPSLTAHADRLAPLDAASLCDGCQTEGIPFAVIDPAIHLLSSGTKMIGLAHPVICERDFLEVWWAFHIAQPGEVLAIQAADWAVVGELFTHEAIHKHLAGIVIDGYARDLALVAPSPMPVYARGTNPRAGKATRATGGASSALIGGVTVNAGDLLFGDQDGIVVIAPEHIAAAIVAAEAVQVREAAILTRVRAGRSVFAHLEMDAYYRDRLAGKPVTLQVRDVAE